MKRLLDILRCKCRSTHPLFCQKFSAIRKLIISNMVYSKLKNSLSFQTRTVFYILIQNQSAIYNFHCINSHSNREFAVYSDFADILSSRRNEYCHIKEHRRLYQLYK